MDTTTNRLGALIERRRERIYTHTRDTYDGIPPHFGLLN